MKRQWHRLKAFLVRQFRGGGGSQAPKTLIRTSTKWVIIFCVFNAWLVNSGVYEPYRVVDMDRLARFAPDDSRIAGDHPAAVVLIHDDDFKQYFEGRLPLSPAPLLNVLRTLCQLPVAKVGVDVFSDRWPGSGASTKMSLQKLDAAVANLGNCPIVWIRAADEEKSVSAKDATSFILGGVLGREAPSAEVCTALPVFEGDFDNVIRQDRSWVLAGVDANDKRPYVTMPEALRAHTSSCGFLENGGKKPDPVTIGYRRNAQIIRLSFSDFYFDGPESQREGFYESRKELARSAGIGRDTIVILGAAYSDARDRYSTPVGEMYGTEILANAAIGQPIGELSFWSSLAVDCTVSWVLMCLLSFVPSFTLRSILSFALSMAFAFWFAWILYNKLGLFSGIYTSLAGTIIAVAADPLQEKIVEDPLWRRLLPGGWRSLWRR